MIDTAAFKLPIRPLAAVLLVSTLAGCGGAAEQTAAAPIPPVVEEARGEVHEWAIRDNAAAILALRNEDPRINAGDENGWTPLHWAAVLENAESVDALLARGANPNAQAKNDETDLSAESLEILVGDDPGNEQAFFEWKNEGDTVLGIAAAANRRKSIALLAEGGADVNGRDANGFTALHNAAVNNARLAAYELIERGASINARGSLEMTPLHLAVAGNAAQAAAELIIRGANINVRMESSATPLHIAAGLTVALEVMDELIRRGANLKARGEDGDTPLHVAVKARNYGAIRRLIEAGANINAWTAEFYTPLHFAVQNNDTRLIEILCNLGANVNAWDEDGDTPLHWAALHDFPETIRVLVEHCEADINFENRRKETPLDLAVGRGKQRRD